MINAADIAVAEDNLKRIRRLVLTGKRLQRCVSIEDYDKIIRYNAVADAVLSEYPSISVEDYQVGESVTKRVVSLEGLLSSIKDFILGGKKEAAVTKENIPFWKRLEWLDQDVESLIANYEEREGSIGIAKSWSPFFKTSAKLSAAIKADTAQYKSAFQRAKPELDRQKAFMAEIDRKTSPFMGNTDKPEAFAAVIRDINAKQTIGLAAKWTDNGYSYLGWGKMPYLEKSTSTGKGMFYSSAGGVEGGSTIDVPRPNKAELIALVAALKALCEVYASIEEYSDEYPSGVDFTDAPYRGYIDYDEIDTLLSEAFWGMEVFEDNNTNFVTQLCERIYGLAEAMLIYLELVFK